MSYSLDDLVGDCDDYYEHESISGLPYSHPDKFYCTDPACREDCGADNHPGAMPTAYCDYCKRPVILRKVYDKNKMFWWLEPVEAGSGSDYLAIWCAECGPKHRTT